MSDFSTGDFCFIILILAVIHGIMAAIGWRRRKAGRGSQPASE